MGARALFEDVALYEQQRRPLLRDSAAELDGLTVF
jgi:hypothetical protein